MPQLQGVGFGKAVAQFRGALSMSLPWQVALLGVAPLTALLTWLSLLYAKRRNLIDQPGDRRSHSIATPRGGGIGIVLSMLVVLCGAGFYWPALWRELGCFSAGLLMVAGIGWWDDHRPLPASVRLAVHMLASLVVGGLALQGGASIGTALLVVFLTVSLINVWNFMDGINGLAASQAMIAASAIALLLPAEPAVFGLALALACLGFLPFNFPRARIFLGDVGSGAIGYMVAGVACLTALRTETNWLLLLLPLLAFFGDAGLTLTKRIATGQRWTQPHTQHLYQRLARKFGSHTLVTVAYGLFTLGAGGLLHHFRAGSLAVAMALLVSSSLLVTACWLFLGKEPLDKG